MSSLHCSKRMTTQRQAQLAASPFDGGMHHALPTAISTSTVAGRGGADAVPAARSVVVATATSPPRLGAVQIEQQPQPVVVPHKDVLVAAIPESVRQFPIAGGLTATDGSASSVGGGAGGVGVSAAGRRRPSEVAAAYTTQAKADFIKRPITLVTKEMQIERANAMREASYLPLSKNAHIPFHQPDEAVHSRVAYQAYGPEWYGCARYGPDAALSTSGHSPSLQLAKKIGDAAAAAHGSSGERRDVRSNVPVAHLGGDAGARDPGVRYASATHSQFLPPSEMAQRAQLVQRIRDDLAPPPAPARPVPGAAQLQQQIWQQHGGTTSGPLPPAPGAVAPNSGESSSIGARHAALQATLRAQDPWCAQPGMMRPADDTEHRNPHDPNAMVTPKSKEARIRDCNALNGSTWSWSASVKPPGAAAAADLSGPAGSRPGTSRRGVAVVDSGAGYVSVAHAPLRQEEVRDRTAVGAAAAAAAAAEAAAAKEGNGGLERRSANSFLPDGPSKKFFSTVPYASGCNATDRFYEAVGSANKVASPPASPSAAGGASAAAAGGRVGGNGVASSTSSTIAKLTTCPLPFAPEGATTATSYAGHDAAATIRARTGAESARAAGVGGVDQGREGGQKKVGAENHCGSLEIRTDGKAQFVPSRVDLREDQTQRYVTVAKSSHPGVWLKEGPTGAAAKPFSLVQLRQNAHASLIGK
jgi:hypothetical protein